MYAISGFTTRPTVDADYLLKNHSNRLESINILVNKIIEVASQNDFIEFDVRNVEVISEAKEYHGVRVNLMGYIGATRTPFSIDFGVGDVVVPSALLRTLPALLPDFEEPEVLTYSLESTIAEKLDAIISLMEITGRMKDIFDIYYLATTFDFEGRQLQEAIHETLSNRGTPYERDSVIAISSLVRIDAMQERWRNFCRKVLRYKLDFETVIEVITDFTRPPFEAMVREDEFFGLWKANACEYVKGSRSYV